MLDGRCPEARGLLKGYMEWFGPGSVCLKLQHNLLLSDTARNRGLARLVRDTGAPMVATNDVHYHTSERYRLQHALVAARRNTTVDQAFLFISPNHHLHLKSQAELRHLFRECPEAVANTLCIAEQYAFDLSTDLGYTLPEPAVPADHTPGSYLRQL